jgi:NarL family two-component system response regulator LiaR
MDRAGNGEQRKVPAERRKGGDRRRAITVVSVDDEPIIRAMLTQMLTGSGLKLIGEADNGHDAVELVVDLRPDVVTMDLGLPGISGVQATEQISLLAPASRVLILTGSEQNSVEEAIVAGASGYVLKTAPTEEIIAAVIATANGKAVLSPQIAEKLLERIRELGIPTTDQAFATASAANAIRTALTARELEIFTRLASGATNHRIGAELALSTNTIANHITSILAKLHLENRIQAAVQAVRAGIA